jgi:hypothetical protein
MMFVAEWRLVAVAAMFVAVLDIFSASRQSGAFGSKPMKVVSFSEYDLGSGLIDQSQKMTAAAMQIADMKV